MIFESPALGEPPFNLSSKASTSLVVHVFDDHKMLQFSTRRIVQIQRVYVPSISVTFKGKWVQKVNLKSKQCTQIMSFEGGMNSSSSTELEPELWRVKRINCCSIIA